MDSRYMNFNYTNFLSRRVRISRIFVNFRSRSTSNFPLNVVSNILTLKKKTHTHIYIYYIVGYVRISNFPVKARNETKTVEWGKE